MPPRYRKVDKNQKEVVAKLREMGYDVVSIAVVGDDIPDLVIGKDSLNLLVELKSGKNKPSEGQVEFSINWGGYSTIAYTAEEIDDNFRKYKNYLIRKFSIES